MNALLEQIELPRWWPVGVLVLGALMYFVGSLIQRSGAIRAATIASSSKGDKEPSSNTLTASPTIVQTTNIGLNEEEVARVLGETLDSRLGPAHAAEIQRAYEQGKAEAEVHAQAAIARKDASIAEMQARLSGMAPTVEVSSQSTVAVQAATTLFNAAGQRLAEGKLYEAAGLYTAVLVLDPKMATAFYNRGITRLGLGALNEAITDYDNAIAIDPTLANAYNNRGFANLQRGDNQAAIRDFSDFIRLRPGSYFGYVNRATAASRAGDFEQANEDIAKALQLHDKDANVHVSHGVILGRQQRYHAAIAAFNRALAIDANCGQAYLNRGTANRFLGHVLAAEQDEKRGRELLESAPNAYTVQGFIIPVNAQRVDGDV